MNAGQLSRRGAHGFTLIELLVVIAIISLLVSILLPTLQAAKDAAIAAICATNQHSLSLGIAMYASEQEDQAPPIIRGGEDYACIGYDNAMWLPNYVSVFDHFSGLGLLVYTECTELNEGLYCPSLKDGERCAAENAVFGLPAYPDGTYRTYGLASSYQYRTYPRFYNTNGTYVKPYHPDCMSQWPSAKAMVHDQLYKLGDYGSFTQPPCHLSRGGMNWLAVNGASTWHDYDESIIEGYEGTGDKLTTWWAVQTYVDEMVDGIESY